MEEDKIFPDLDDDSPMPFGAYKGTRMLDVPIKELLYLYDTDRCNKRVSEYIEKNLTIFRKMLEYNRYIKVRDVRIQQIDNEKKLLE